jgi:hypothetical protein
MKKIFLVVCHAVCNLEDCGINIIAFEKKEDAKKYFNEQVEYEKDEINGLDWIISTDTDTEFEAYEDGDYTRKHTMCEIRELVIE